MHRGQFFCYAEEELFFILVVDIGNENNVPQNFYFDRVMYLFHLWQYSKSVRQLILWLSVCRVVQFRLYATRGSIESLQQPWGGARLCTGSGQWVPCGVEKSQAGCQRCAHAADTHTQGRAVIKKKNRNVIPFSVVLLLALVIFSEGFTRAWFISEWRDGTRHTLTHSTNLMNSDPLCVSACMSDLLSAGDVKCNWSRLTSEHPSHAS